MSGVDDSKRRQAQGTLMLVIWFFLLMTVLAYAGIGLILTAGGDWQSPAPELATTLRLPLAAVALIGLIGAGVYASRVADSARLRRPVSGSAPAGNAAPSPLARLQLAFIIQGVAGEVPAIYGLVLFLIGGQTTDLFAFVGLSVAFFLFWLLPVRSRYLALAEELAGGSGQDGLR